MVGMASAFTPLSTFVFTLSPLVIILTLIGYLIAISASINCIKWIMIAGILGFTIEVIGVSTGVPFGNYSYGSGLSIKLFDVPVVLIANWALLTSISLYATIKTPPLIQVSLPPVLITLLDFFIEPVAIHYNWWSWEYQDVPLSNYLGWVVSAFFINLLLINTIKENNLKKNTVGISQFLLFVQFLFFGVLNLSL
jgi:Predicted membrane protein